MSPKAVEFQVRLWGSELCFPFPFSVALGVLVRVGSIGPEAFDGHCQEASSAS